MFLLKLLIRNVFRHKLRTFLTILSITIAILAFGLLRTFISAWYAGVQSFFSLPPGHSKFNLPHLSPFLSPTKTRSVRSKG